MSSRHNRRSIAVLAIVVALSLVASACSDSGVNAARSASGGAGNPVDLPALPSTTATGERIPEWYLAEVTPSSWVSTSLTPTLMVPGALGAWTFKLSDLSDGTSSFGTRSYSEVGASTRIPADTLQNGNTYSWIAESPGRESVGGSFTVDVQMLAAQQSDALGGVEALLSSGEAAYSWKSHTMQAIGSAIGVSLRFQASSNPQPGVPSGWRLSTSSGSPYLSVVSREDGSVGLVAQSGQVSSYRRGAGSSWNPVRMAGDGLNTAGLAPVLIENSDGSWSVTTKSSTARFVDDDGDGIANLAEISADGAPVVQQQWKNGLLRSIVDPVSGRSVNLVYGGESCPKPVSGFVPAPSGMLCQVTFWDGSTSAFSYVTLPDGSVSIGRLSDFPEAAGDGALVSDLAYDAAGRIAITRSPLVAAATAASLVNVDDGSFLVEVAYRPDGRVESITNAAPSPGVARCRRSYSNEGTSSSVTDSCLDKVVTTLTFDGSTFFPLTTTDVLGRVTTNTWNLITGELLTVVDGTGRITEHSYENGNLVRMVGPSRDLSTAPVTVNEFDETYAQRPDGDPMRGLDVVYWPSIDDRGADAVQELGPLQGGQLVSSLAVNWETSPAGNRSGGWSGLMTGTLQIENAGVYAFASGNSDARLRVANLACEDGGCASVQLPAGPVSIRVEIMSETPDASIDLTWAGPDSAGVQTSIPTDRLRPQYNLGTEARAFDPTAVRSNSDSINRTSFANPSKGMVTARTNGAGTVSEIVYEGGGWNRPTASVLPAGNRIVQTWWGDRESATAPCPGAKAAVQGGAAKQTITPSSDGGEGPAAQQWYTASGALAGSRLSGGVTSCATYDRSGRPIRTETIGLGETSRTEIDYEVDGNPFVTKTTETQGDQVTTSISEIDFAGRIVRSVDRNGIVTITTYDNRTGTVATSTSTPPGGVASVMAMTYDQFGRPTSTTLDGRVVSTIRYGQYGLPDRVTYGDGAITDYTIDAQNNVVGAVTLAAGHSYASSRVVSAAGVTSSARLAVDELSSTFGYTHDANGRLSAISLSSGLAPEARAWVYGYDANSNRTSQVRTIGSRTDEYTYAYDAADRLVSTTDPAAAGAITYDERGNALNIGPDSFTYDMANLLTSVTDGSTTVTFLRSATGSVIGKTTADAKGTNTVRYGAAGFILDEQGRAIEQITSLPGGVRLSRPLGATARAEWDFTTIRGDRFFSLDDAGARLGEISMFTPFGESVMGAQSIDGARPDLSWKAVEGNETLALRTPIVAMGQRVYVPALGRFIQVDPVVGGSANGYDYANQDPTSFTDPAGTDLDSWGFIGSMVVGVAGVALMAFGKRLSDGALYFLLGAVGGAGVGLALSLGINKATTGSATGDSTTMLISVLAGALLGGIGLKVMYARSLRTGVRAAASTGQSQADALIDGLRMERTSGPRKMVSENAVIHAVEDVPQPARVGSVDSSVSPKVSVQPPKVAAVVRESSESSSTERIGSVSLDFASNGDFMKFLNGFPAYSGN